MGRIFEKRKESIFKTAAQKSKLYSKYAKQLYVAAKNGVPDPEANPALRSLVERAKRDNVATHVVEKAIQKAAGSGGEDFQSGRYEGFGPGGSLLIVACLTDPPQARKTLSGEDLSIFEKLLGMLNDCDDVQEIYHNVSGL